MRLRSFRDENELVVDMAAGQHPYFDPKDPGLHTNFILQFVADLLGMCEVTLAKRVNDMAGN